MKRKILWLFLLVCFFRGFFANTFPSAKYLWDLLLIITSFFYFNDYVNILKSNKKILIFYILFLCSFLISTINSQRLSELNILLNNVIEFGYMNAFWIIVVVLKYSIDDKSTIFLWRTVVFLSVIQILFDLLYIDASVYQFDRFSGTMFMANQKSRMLILVVLFYLVLMFFNSNMKNIYLKLIFLGMMITSFIIGFSNLTYFFIGISIIISLVFSLFFYQILYKFKKGKFLNLLVAIIIGVSVFYIKKFFVDVDNFESMYTITEARFFNEQYGVYAIFLYAIDIIKESYFLGTGGGTFMSRMSTAIGSDILMNAPGTMVVYGELSKGTTVDGVSSFLNITVEYGLIGLVSYLGLLLIIFKDNGYYKTYLFRLLFIATSVYLVLINIYTPYYFDNEFGYILTITYILGLKNISIAQRNKHQRNYNVRLIQ